MSCPSVGFSVCLFVCWFVCWFICLSGLSFLCFFVSLVCWFVGFGWFAGLLVCAKAMMKEIEEEPFKKNFLSNKEQSK